MPRCLPNSIVPEIVTALATRRLWADVEMRAVFGTDDFETAFEVAEEIPSHA